MDEPELRFKDDDGTEFPEWEEDELGNYCNSISSGKVKALETDGQYILYGSTGEIGRTNIPEFTGTHVTIARVGANAGTVNLRSGIYGVSDNTLVIDHKDNLIPEYLANRLISYDLGRLIFGSGQPLITGRQLKTLILKFPCVEEQQKIANLFSTLDNVIDSVQKEVDSWEQMKRGVMQKLFSQEVRFKADDGTEFPEWGKVKLSDVTYYSKDKIDAKDIMTEEYVSTDTMLQNFAGIKTSETVPTSATLCSFQTGDILMADIRPYLKKIWLADMDGACNSDVLVIRPKNGINSRFIYDGLTQDSFITYVMSSAKGSKMPRGDKKMIMNYEIPEVCFEEQQKIVDCLSEFDSVIEKTKQKLEAFKQMKKGLMQRMFV